LFWTLLGQKERDDLRSYAFIKNYKEGKHNDEDSSKSDDLIFVLDGQQRLTSLLIGLKGSYTIKRKNHSPEDPELWDEMQLYINLLKDPKAENITENDALVIG
jgi:uncharacterized protein with ParB-like and HNH nuclease domain